MLGSKLLFVPGLIILIVGFTLEAGATGAVKAIKMSTKLLTRPQPADVATDIDVPAAGLPGPDPDNLRTPRRRT